MPVSELLILLRSLSVLSEDGGGREIGGPIRNPGCSQHGVTRPKHTHTHTHTHTQTSVPYVFPVPCNGLDSED